MVKLRAFAAVVAALLVAVMATTAPAATPARQAKLRQLAQSLVRAGAPGAIVFVRAPSATRSAVSGFSNLEPRVPMRASDRFRVASITKTFVATIVLQLEAEGKLDIDDPVERWLPGGVPNGASITLRELLSHTSGIFNYTDDQAFIGGIIANPSRAWSPGELLSVAFSHAAAANVTTFYAALLKGRLLPAAQLAEIKAPSPVVGTYGLGLTLTSTRCGRAVGHDGDFPGWRSIVLATPNGRREAVLMINVDESRVPWSRLEAAAGIALCSG